MKLCIPDDVLKQHTVTLGKTGSGKSSVLRYLVEHLLTLKRRVCIIDPKGDWWGLKSSADGKSAGFPVITFGDFKNSEATDVPINAQSGKHVAELISSGNRPCVIGFRGWMPGQMTDFWIDFASTLFNSSEGELYVVIDECHNFMPKGKILDPKAGMVLHWSNRLLSEGRGLGMVFLLASQRPQKVHNDALTCCETLVAMRVNHAADREAIKDWIDGCGDPVHGKEVLANVAGMSRGEAFVWSPEISYGPERVKFPMFSTFDSFAPPQLQKKVSSKGWSDVDLEDVKAKLATVIEEAKANDPRELKRKIAELQRELAAKPKDVKPVAEVERLDPEKMQAVVLAEVQHIIDTAVYPAIKLKVAENLAIVADQLESAAESAATLRQNAEALRDPKHWNIRFLTEQCKQAAGKAVVRGPATVNAPRLAAAPLQNRAQNIPKNIPQNLHTPNTETRAPRAGARRILAACIQWHPHWLTRSKVGALVGMKKSGGTFGTYLSDLRVAGLIDVNGDEIRATQRALDEYGDSAAAAPKTTEEVVQLWRSKQRAGAMRILAELIELRGAGISRADLAEVVGMAASGGTFGTYLSDLRTAQLIVDLDGGAVAANIETLFL